MDEHWRHMGNGDARPLFTFTDGVCPKSGLHVALSNKRNPRAHRSQGEIVVLRTIRTRLFCFRCRAVSRHCLCFLFSGAENARSGGVLVARSRAESNTPDLFFGSIARSRPSLFGFIHCQHGGPRSNAACRGAWCVVSQLRFSLNSATAKPRTSTPGLLACPPLPRTPEHRRRPGLLACSLCVLPLTSERFRSGRGRLRGRREPHEQPKSQCESREF